jgi:hypothetical protein
MQSHGKDLKGQTLSHFARAATAAITAAGAGDNTEITGDSINLSSLASRPSSVVVEIPVTATLAATETCIVVGELEKSVDGSTWSDLVASATLLTLTGASGGSTEKGVARIGADLIQSDANYIRFKATPDLSRAGTDTMQVGAAVAVFGGLQNT